MTYFKKCKICNHKDREKIEAMILLNSPRIDIERTYGMNRANVITHIRHTEIQPESKPDRTARIREADRIRTLADRKKCNVTEEDFEDSGRVKELKKFMRLFRPWAV